MDLDFRKPVLFHDAIVCESRVTEMGNSSFKMEQLLRDSETGEVYRADLDFYDSYDLHRGEFENPNLYKIDDRTSNYYLSPVDYYITK